MQSIDKQEQIMKNYNRNQESSYIQYLEANNLYGWAMLQRLPIGGPEWDEDLLFINEKLLKNIKLIKHYDEESDNEFILKVDIEYPQKNTWFAWWFTTFAWKNEN